MLEIVLTFFIELIHGIGLLIPFAIYFIDIPKWLIIISLMAFITIPFLWYIFNDKCVISNVASNLTNDSRSFSEKYLWWIYKYLKIFLSKESKKKEVTDFGTWIQWYFNTFLIWFYIFFYNKKKFI